MRQLRTDHRIESHSSNMTREPWDRFADSRGLWLISRRFVNKKEENAGNASANAP